MGTTVSLTNNTCTIISLNIDEYVYAVLKPCNT